MPNNPKLYDQKDIKPLKERYQDVNKNEIKVLGKVWANIENNSGTRELPILIFQRNKIAPLLDVNRLKQLPSKKSIGQTHQTIKRHSHKFPQIVGNKSHNQKHRSKNQIKPDFYLFQQKASSIPYHLQQDVRNELDRIIKSGHLERLETIEDACFVSVVVFTVNKDKTVNIALDVRTLIESCVKKDHACQTRKNY